MELAQLLPPPVFEADPAFAFEADLEQAARALDLERWVLQRLKHAEREITVNIPLIRDDGSAVNLTGYRVQHSRGQGPCIGPVLLSPDTHTTALRTAATEITLQAALLGLRLGGAAGAVVIDPDQFSERELRHVIKDFIVALHENSGPLRDVLACDDNEYIAGWMDEANTHARGWSEPAAIVGKTDGESLLPAWAGTLGSLIQNALGRASLTGLRIALQGFGHRARILAGSLDAQGAKLVALADRSGGLMRDDGIDVIALGSHVEQTGVGFGFVSAEPATNSDVLECECDLLILAAAQKQVGAHNAGRVRAQAILELTQGALNRSAETTLPPACLVVPHLICGAAQLAIWAHEWQRGLSYSAPEPRKAKADASALVVHAFERARRMASYQRISVREAALISALGSLAKSLRLR